MVKYKYIRKVILKMKKDKLLYYFCKGINCLHWFILMVVCGILSAISGTNDSDLFSYSIIVALGCFLFVIFWFRFSSSRSRILYQMWFFISYIYAEYCMIFAPDGEIFSLGMYINATVFQKIVLTWVCICAFACKIYTMYYETEEYSRGESTRHNNRLADRVYSAIYDLENATTAEDKRRAEAKLERAKLERELYSWDDDN